MTSCTPITQNEQLFRIVLPFLKLQEPLTDLNPNHLTFTPLKGGGSQAMLYRFDLNKQSYVLRLLPPHADQFTRMHQITLATEAGQTRIGPEIYFVDSQLKGIIMDFIPGRTVQQADFENPNKLTQFAKLLKKLHQSTTKFPIACSPFQRFHDFLLKGIQNTIVYSPRFAETITLMKELETTLKLKPIPLVPAHLDLHPLNIMIENDQFLLVDWVNGGISDPYFDLATFTTFLNLNDSQILTFLTQYLERPPTQFERHRFIITKPIRPFVIAAALLTLSTDKSNIQLGLSMLKTGLTISDQNNFKVALKNLQRNN